MKLTPSLGSGSSTYKAIHEKGLFIVQNIYDGVYDYFAPSPLFDKKSEAATPAKPASSKQS